MASLIRRRKGGHPSPAIIIFPLLFLITLLAVNLSPISLLDHAKVRPIPTIWVVSHRRSGTHLSMDLLAEILPSPFRLVKTNHVYLTDDHTAKDTIDGLNCRCLNYMRRRGRIIHAHRDIRDVVTSSYYYYQTYNAPDVRNVTKKGFFENENGARNKVIGTWVNTTAPYFAQSDIMQLAFSDSLSGFEHVQDRILSFLGYGTGKNAVIDPVKLQSVSHAVARRAGKGDHGYRLELSDDVASEILHTARHMEHEKRKSMVSCDARANRLGLGLQWIQDIMDDGFWVGGNETYRMWAPSYCPLTFKGSRVVIRNLK